MTHCPSCGEASEQFSMAHYQETGAEMRSSRPQAAPVSQSQYPLLVCPTCDDQFRPEFYHQCAWCGHDFKDGQRRSLNEIFRALSRRELATIIGLFAVALGSLIWFAIVLRG